ncbi:MAG: hypothetical protein HYS41_06860, partial [Candidatus Omnitrophica bacterium]|nr:hypothetical protein [Candidatus Omnitrophota bacterium]
NTSGIKILKFQLTSTEPVLPNISATLYTSAWSRVDAIPKPALNFNTGIPYATIQAAIEAASPDDEIRVQGAIPGFSGLFTENLTINKSLTLKGSYDADFTTQDYATTPTTIDGQGQDAVTLSNGTAFIINITLDGLVIRNSANGILSDSALLALSLQDCTTELNVKAIYLPGIDVSGYFSMTRCVVRNNTGSRFTRAIIHIDGEAAGPITISDSEIRGNVSIGHFVGSYAWGLVGTLLVEGTADAVVIQNSLITGNEVRGGHAGGVIQTASVSTLTIAGTRIETNSVLAPNRGELGGSRGIVNIRGSAPAITITNSQFSSNSVTGRANAAIIFQGINSAGTVTFSNNLLDGNTVQPHVGWTATLKHFAIVAFQEGVTSSLGILNSRFSNNSIGGGEGIAVGVQSSTIIRVADHIDNAGGSLSFQNSEFNNNSISGGTSSESSGCGIIFALPDSFSMTNCRLVENTLKRVRGGFGLIVTASDSISIVQCEVKGNKLSSDGSSRLRVLELGGPTSQVANSEISGNEIGYCASFSGIVYINTITFSMTNSDVTKNLFVTFSSPPSPAIGGIFRGSGNTDHTYTFTNCTFALNSITAPLGDPPPGIYFSIVNVFGPIGIYTLTNSILYGNSFSPPVSLLRPAAFPLTHTDRQDTGSCTADPDGNINCDPLFVDSANGDFHLQAASPCVDAGDPAADSNDPDGTRNDMGAFGGPGASNGMGTFTPIDDPATPDIREDIIGTFGPQP